MRRPAVALIATTLTAGALGFVPAANAEPDTGAVSGTVTDGELPLEGITVEIRQYDAEGQYWPTVAEDQTRADGSYLVPVPDGEYRIGFRDYAGTYATEFFDDTDFVSDADTITVPSPAAAGVDAELVAGASLGGEVTDSEGQPLEDIAVTAYRVVGTGADTEYRYAGFDLSDRGSYTIGGLPDGTYVVEFTEFNERGVPRVYATEFNGGKPNRFSATRLTLTTGEAREDVGATMEPDSTIAGRIADASNAPITTAWVTALGKVGDEWLPVGYGEVSDTGSYRIEGLAADTYRVQFDAEVDGRYYPEFWDNQPTVATATDVVLGIDDSEAGVNAVIIPGEHDTITPMVENLTPVAITGTPRVGSPLTSSAGTWSPEPALVEYYWVAGEEVLQAGTSATYVPTPADLGKTISVYVYASVEGYDYGWSSAVASGPVTAAPVVTPPVVTPPVVTPPVVTPATALAAILGDLEVAGKPKVGKTVKVTGLDASLRTKVKYAFQWFAGKKAIRKATADRLKIKASMKGKRISVKVTAKAAGAKKSTTIKLGKVR